MPAIRIVNAALDEVNGDIVLRGVVSPESIVRLRTAPYQREVLPVTSLSSIVKALNNGQRLPDIELSMRGQKFKEVESGIFDLQNDVFIVDGLQRTTGALHFLAKNQEGNPHLGACIYFGKDESWEADRFRILNTLRTKVAPSVLLRNMSADHKSAEVLYSMCLNDSKFAMRGRVCFEQRMKRGELITALQLARTIGFLHSHKAAGRNSQVDLLIPALDKAIDIFGVQNFRENTRTFFDLIDSCFGIGNIKYREGAIQLRGTFLAVLASFLSDHHDFWMQDSEERKLFVDSPLRKKLSQFPINDPEVMRLAGSGGKSREILYTLIRDHINSGKRTRRLRSRNGDNVTSTLNGHFDEYEQHSS